VYFKYATQNYCIQNYIPINSDINLQNNFNSTAITNPTIINGICHGSGDGASYSNFNLGIASWYGIGFIDSCYRKCVICFDVRGGHITHSGTHTCNNIVCNSTANIISSGSYNLTQTQLGYLSNISSDVQNQINTINNNNNSTYYYNIINSISGNIYTNYALKSWVQSQGYLTSGSYLPLIGGTMTGCINFNNTMTLSTTYTGCRISLWYDISQLTHRN